LDEDNLFVCFSNDALEAPRGEPPFHDNICDFAATIDKHSFLEFFEGRFAWHWYPIISSGLSTFPTHGDLPDNLNEDKRLLAVGYAASICAQEEGKRFISGLGLLFLLCGSVKTPKPVPELSCNFMAIRERVTRNAIDPNIHFWFSKIVLYQINTSVVPEGYNGSFDRKGMNAPRVENNG
jgi:hypothetical protein